MVDSVFETARLAALAPLRLQLCLKLGRMA